MSHVTVRDLVERFVERYNQPGSDVYPLCGPEVDWIEMPSGRHGDRDAFFAALKEAREAISDLRIEVISITADEDAGSAVLESNVTGLKNADGRSFRLRVLWFLAFRDGLICKEHDYSFAIPE